MALTIGHNAEKIVIIKIGMSFARIQLYTFLK